MTDTEIPRMPRWIARWTWFAHWYGFYCAGWVCVPKCNREHSS